jgi:hypothetical protein
MLTRSTKNATNFDGGMDVATGRIETDGQRTFPEFSNVSYARVCARARERPHLAVTFGLFLAQFVSLEATSR